MQYLALMALSFGIVYLLVPLNIKLAYLVGAVDKPNNRKVHSKLMPRLGGLAIYLGFVVTVLLTQKLQGQMYGLLLGGTLITVLGVLDDIKDISPRIKLLGQIVAAGILILFNIKVNYVTHPFSGDIKALEWYFSIPVTIIWIVGITNALNLIDGLDGLAAGVSSIASIILAFVTYSQGQYHITTLALILAAASLGFLKYNFHPARIFMGDTGSMFLGFILGALSIIGPAKTVTVISVFVPILILGIPIFDTLFAIIRRYKNSRPIFKADKEHLHHCLLNKGLSHRQTVLFIYLINIFLGGTAVLLTHMTTAQGMLILACLSIFILWGAQRIGIIGRSVSGKIPEKVARKET